MEITLDGVQDIYKEEIKQLIDSILKIKFQDNQCALITEIFIPPDFINNPYSNLMVGGKCYHSNGSTKIYLNPKIYKYGILSNNEQFLTQCSTIFHELVHAETYQNSYKAYSNPNFKIDVDLSSAYFLWDEYFAVRETAKHIPENNNSYFLEFIELISNENVRTIKNLDTYIGEVIRLLSTILGIIDGGNIQFKESLIENINNSFLQSSYLKVWNILENIKSTPDINDLIIINQFIQHTYKKLKI